MKYASSLVAVALKVDRTMWSDSFLYNLHPNILHLVAHLCNSTVPLISEACLPDTSGVVDDHDKRNP
eukprot:CAMPEP_0204651774 /NCGR_PEP_ID=MMETSP0718-20130828/13951_1 /ASSEMBLY_ACC=CAM_ASM_000674 /TAXON_ID=230516 /ORGANISM="Chaetoceros curvisetus" /LENGTH=66 /DNA_ID=CAMNT_0051675621 /DNA_START=97 /DNA_END=294 /DNA_ORIENTATION=-